MAYLGALALLFSYAESILPRFTPFFRLGLSNVAVLSSLSLDFPSFLALCVVKSASSSLVSGTLFSPFFIVSIAQSVVSGSFMFALPRIFGKRISVYGVSVSGAAVSSAVQVFLCSLYLGSGTFVFFGPMLVFSVFSGFFTAFVCSALKIRDGGLPPAASAPLVEPQKTECGTFARSFLLLPVVFSLSVIVFSTDRIALLVSVFAVAAALQKMSGRRFLFVPHLAMWGFVFLSSVFVPDGKVVFRIWKFSVTDGALLLAAEKCVRLSSSMCLSQFASSVPLPKNSVVSLSIAHFHAMTARFESGGMKGRNFVERLRFVVNG